LRGLCKSVAGSSKPKEKGRRRTSKQKKEKKEVERCPMRCLLAAEESYSQMDRYDWDALLAAFLAPLSISRTVWWQWLQRQLATEGNGLVRIQKLNEKD